MQMQTVRPTILLALMALAALTASCGDPQGSEVGKDPNVPVALKPKTPEQTNPDQPLNSAPTPVDGNNSGTGTGDNTTPGTTPDISNPQPQPAPVGNTLTVLINGIRSVRGNVCLSLFNSPDGFPDSADKAILAECFTVVGSSFEIKIDSVPTGTYAIALWHDENRDGKMNYNFLGIPKEGVAFSENGRPRITPPPPGPPSFQAISFEMKNEARSTSTKMTYLLDFL
jgi:uncharacterized protein (DUF2141 family)